MFKVNNKQVNAGWEMIAVKVQSVAQIQMLNSSNANTLGNSNCERLG